MSTSSVVNISSFPSELLEDISKNVVQDTPAEERALTALGLTHVSRSFRRVAVDCPQLWTCLSRKLGRPGLPLIKACIERSRNQPLDVVLYFYTFDEKEAVVVDDILGTILPHCARWRSWSWQFLDLPDEKYGSYSKSHSLPTLVNMPLLEDLSIARWPSSGLPFELFLDFLQQARKRVWNVPKVRAVTLKNTSASAFPSAIHAQLRSLTVICQKTEFTHHTRSLQRLSETTCLTTIRLSLVDCYFCRSTNDVSDEFPSVKFLHVELLNCSQNSPRPHILWGESRTFYFPNLVELSITLKFGDKDNHLMMWNGYDITLYSLLAANLENPQRYPSLETLDVTVLPGSRTVPRKGKSRLPTLLLPHCCIPSLK